MLTAAQNCGPRRRPKRICTLGSRRAKREIEHFLCFGLLEILMLVDVCVST